MSNQAVLQVLAASLGVAACLVVLRAQTPPGQPPAFEVASIKENVSAGRPTCGTRAGRGRMMTTAVAMRDFARNLAPFAGRPLIDKTGLTGNYDIDLTWTPEPPGLDSSAASTAPGDAPSLFTAVQEQLGLKLDAQRGPVDVLVIESAQRSVQD